jgi:hypothetical protein
MLHTPAALVPGVCAAAAGGNDRRHRNLQAGATAAAVDCGYPGDAVTTGTGAAAIVLKQLCHARTAWRVSSLEFGCLLSSSGHVPK